MEKINCDTILDQLQEWVENKQVITGEVWLNACGKLNILRGDEHNKLFDLQQAVAQQKCLYLGQNEPIGKAKIQVEALDCYKQMLQQKAKMERIEETIRIGKLQARLANEEYRHAGINNNF